MATPGVSTRMWEPTPGHATPGAVTPGRETPGHDKGLSSRRNRWDETPKTERGEFPISLCWCCLSGNELLTLT